MKHLFNGIVASTLVALSPAFAMAQTLSPTKAITFVGPVAPGSSNDLIARMLSEKLPATHAAAVQRPNTDINAALATPEFRDKLRDVGVQITGGISGDAAKLARDTGERNPQVGNNLIITVECATS